MEPMPGARWALPDREWGLTLQSNTLVLLERKTGTLNWSGVGTMALPDLIDQVEDWIKGTVVPTLQRLLDAIWPPSTVATPPPATLATVVEAALRRGAVQYISTHRKFGYVPKDPGNV